MSVLSEEKFENAASFAASLSEGIRQRLRGTVKSVQSTAAWQNWPTVHRIAKALKDRLTTQGDLEAARLSQLESMAERCAAFYPTEASFPFADDPERMRQEVALTIGGGLTDDNPNAHGITLDDVLDLYRARYASPAECLAPPEVP